MENSVDWDTQLISHVEKQWWLVFTTFVFKIIMIMLDVLGSLNSDEIDSFEYEIW